MIKVEITGGYVEINDRVTRKIARDYVKVLTAHSTADGDITRTDMEDASENLTLALVDKAVMVAADGSEHTVTVDQDWLDNLDESDFQKVGGKVYSIYKASKEQSKK